MKYQYKAVSWLDFIKENEFVKTIHFPPNQYQRFLKDPSAVVEEVINFYACQGWEYVRSEELHTNQGRAQMFIFRKELTKEDQEKRDKEFKELSEEEERRARIPPGAAREPSENPNAKCPNCDAPINERDEDCWKCKAAFSGSSAWKPIKK